MEFRGTLSFCALLRQGAFEKCSFTVEDIRELLASSALCNPMDSYRGSCTGEVRYAFTQAFERVLEQGVDWTAVKDEARRVLEVLEEKRRQREKAQEETRLFEVSDFRLFSEWSAAWTSRNVAHVLSFFAAEGLYECLSTSVRILGKPGLATYFTRLFHSSEMTLHVGRVLTDGRREVFLHWTRVGSRCFGVQFPRSRCPISIRGQSKLEIRDFDLVARRPLSGRIERCSEIWDLEDLGFLRKARELAFSGHATP